MVSCTTMRVALPLPSCEKYVIQREVDVMYHLPTTYQSYVQLWHAFTPERAQGAECGFDAVAAGGLGILSLRRSLSPSDLGCGGRAGRNSPCLDRQRARQTARQPLSTPSRMDETTSGPASPTPIRYAGELFVY